MVGERRRRGVWHEEEMNEKIIFSHLPNERSSTVARSACYKEIKSGLNVYLLQHD